MSIIPNWLKKISFTEEKKIDEDEIEELIKKHTKKVLKSLPII